MATMMLSGDRPRYGVLAAVMTSFEAWAGTAALAFGAVFGLALTCAIQGWNYPLPRALLLDAATRAGCLSFFFASVTATLKVVGVHEFHRYGSSELPRYMAFFYWALILSLILAFWREGLPLIKAYAGLLHCAKGGTPPLCNAEIKEVTPELLLQIRTFRDQWH